MLSDIKSIRYNSFILVAALTLSIVSAMFYSFYTGRNIATHYAPLIDAAMEIKLEATTAHLWFEEIISGDQTVDIEIVWGHIDKAKWYAQAMLDGGENSEGKFAALNDSELRLQIEQAIAGIDAFRLIAQERWETQSLSGVGSNIDQRFDETFKHFVVTADNVETGLQKEIARQLHKYYIEQILLIIAIIMFGVIIGIMLYRNDRRRSNDMLALHDREENLRITLNSIGDAVIVTDSNGDITHLNPVAEHLTGWTLERAYRKPLGDVFNIVNSHTREAVVNPVKDVLETGRIVGLAKHTVLISRDGTEYQISDSGAPIRASDGEIIGAVLVFQDITEEYALQSSLESNRLFLATLLHALPDLVWLKDENGVYLACNQRFERFFGASKSEIVGKTDYDFVDKDLADFFREKDRAAIAVDAGQAKTNEEELTFADDGHRELVETLKTPMLDSEGKLVGILGVAREVGHHRQAELKLAESESRLQEALSYAQMGYWDLFSDEKTANWSKQMYQIFGLSSEIKAGPESLCEIINDSDAPKFIKSVETSFANHNEHHVEYRIRRPNDGVERWIECRGKVVLDENGKAEKMSGFIQDITARKLVTQRLAESEMRFQDLLKNIPSVSVQGYRLDGTTTYWNKASEALYGYTEQQAIGCSIFDLIIPEDMANNVNTAMQSMEATGHAIPASELLLRHKDGSRVPVYSSHAIVHSEGRPSELFCIDIDLTERKQAEAKLQLSYRVFSDTHEGITITDANKLIIDVNPAFSEITGYSREDVLGLNPSMLSSGKQSPEFYDAMWRETDENGHWQGEVWNRKKEGELYAELLTISALKDEDEKIVNYVGVFSDITHSKQQQEKLNLMAHYDVLTGLPNRVLFTDRFNQAIAHSQRTDSQLAICFLDLDNFKPINDSYGHEVGDQLLIEVAERITANIRDEDTVSRQGGDEFAILLNDVDAYTQCEQTLERLHHALAQPYLIEDKTHTITASSGITLYPEDKCDIDTLLRHADQAMYQAKLAGKHRYHLFNPQHDQQIVQKHHRLSEIEQALTNKEMTLYYQPKVNMVTGDVFGVEALIRWIHPENGLITPLEFLPVIEGSELEITLGDWVIEQALMQLEKWQQQGIKLEVSINIASYHLQSEGFFSKLDSTLERHPEVDSKYLQLEILESSVLSDLHAISRIIKSCQENLGVNIALDDFGTGYSSLTHLRNLSANVIKIDQTFVRDMLDDPSDYAIVDGVIGLADSFDRDVIAEGVETTEHGLMLLIMGCEDAQGYGIARPMPANEFSEWLSDYTPNQEWQQCGDKHRTVKENKVKLFRLVCEQWQNHFVSNLQSSAENIESWPILGGKQCHCGHWLKRAQKEQLFEQDCLDDLNKAHDQIHSIASTLYSHHQDGHFDKVKGGLDKLQKDFEVMSNVLGRCE